MSDSHPASDTRPPGQRILVIDDEATVALSCQRILGAEGHEVDTRPGAIEGLEAALTGAYDVILLDLMMPEMDGLQVCERIKSAGVGSEIIIITGYSAVQTAVEAMKKGAADYVSKPFTPDELRMVVAKVVERSALLRENAALRQQVQAQHGFEGMIGSSRAMERVFSLVQRVAPTDGTVLIAGESGTGKEMVARAIHTLSRRKNRPLLACDCSSLAPGLLESELFGHVKGAFTGAVASKQGLFEAADKGTLFLDEIANISLETQGKLLRVLESRQIKRVGDMAEHEVDIRLIAATNRNLLELVREGQFREDLFYRLNVVPIDLPPLRERAGDIPRLATTFLERFRKNNAVRVEGFTPEALALLESYRWPGNVRELRNIVERMAILCDSERIEARHLPPEIRQSSPLPTVTAVPEKWEDFKKMKNWARTAAVGELEKRFLQAALDRAGGNVSRAAEDVGMQRTNFHALMRKYGLE
jgi:DNA-binding NtrC family response regulator